MRIRILRPRDVAPEHARVVLDFLNGASSPEEVAIATDIPGVHDIGIRLAERILRRRDELGGFTSLEQLLSVPLIGPLRFTHLVVGLSGAGRRSPPRSGSDDAVQRELAALRAQVDALLRGPAPLAPIVTIRALQPSPWLGEPINLVAEAIDSRGAPVQDLALTLTTSWGRLRARTGARLLEGSAVRLRTDAAGRARALLEPPTAEPLQEVQQSSLAWALEQLDRGAATPAGAAGALRALAEAYRMPGNEALREAIDIYFRDFGAVHDAVNAPDPSLGWAYRDSIVLALSQSGTEGASSSIVQGGAALVVRMKNWLPAWLEALQATTREESRLEIDLELATRGREQGAILGTIYRRVRDFMEEAPGRAGEFVGRRVAESTLADFAQLGMRQLPPTTQLALTPALQLASESVRATGGILLASTNQARHEIRQEVTREIDLKISDRIDRLETPKAIGELRLDFARISERVGGIDALERQLATKLDHDRLESVRAELRQEIDARAPAERIERIETEFLEVRTTLEREAAAIESRIEQQIANGLERGFGAELESRIDHRIELQLESSVEARIGRAVEARIPDLLAGIIERTDAQLAQQLETKLDRSHFERSQAELRTRVEELDARFDPGALDTLHAELRRELEAKPDRAALDQLHAELRKELEARPDRAALDQLHAELHEVLHAELDRQTRRLEEGLEERIDRRIDARLQDGFEGRLDRALGAALDQRLESKLDAANFERFRAEVRQELADRVRIEIIEEVRTELLGELSKRVAIEHFSTYEDRIESVLATKADLHRVEALDRDLDSLQSTTSAVGQNVARLDTSLGRLDLDVRTLKRER